MPRTEASARLKINHLLEEAGWRLFDSSQGKANVSVEDHVRLSEVGDDFENTPKGYIDYLLHDSKGFSLAVLEAKRESTHPLTAKEQAREYALSVHARYIILSNGNVHYLWDTKEGNPELIARLPSPASLEDFQTYSPNPSSLAGETVSEDYIAQSQLPGFQHAPEWQAGGEKREFFRQSNKLVIMRSYQLQAIHAIQQAASHGKERFLLEMATGTGKTLTCAAIIKLFLRTSNAKRVLFLVDRIELERQAATAFRDYLGKDYTSVIYKNDRDGWQKSQIVITTVQSLLVSNRYRDLFSPTDFELVISDEAHRSINGDARAVFEYFVGYRVGLTATPKDYLKNVDFSDSKTQRDFERRQLLSTYTTFGCESGQPTYSFSLKDGVPVYLVSPIVVDARTQITTKLLSEEGFSIHKVTSQGDEVDGVFVGKDYERKIFNEETNRIMCEEFIKQAEKDPISGEVGKSLVFAVSQVHASKLVDIFNHLAHELWPGKYQSDFAIQVTSNVPDSQDYTTKFTSNNLLGHTNWLPNYDSSRARICVTVAMMTTGYDCPDLLNIGLMRPVYSPSDFIQMKGRGTRKHTFKYTDYDHDEELITVEKTHFKLIDFFAVVEYFTEKYDYTVPLRLPTKVVAQQLESDFDYSDLGPNQDLGDSVIFEPPPSQYPVNINATDQIETITTFSVGSTGMRVDQEMFKSFVAEQQADSELVQRDQTDRSAAIAYLKEKVLDKPRYYMTLEKMSKLFKLGRRIDIDEALDLIMGRIDQPKTKQELLDEKFTEAVQLNGLTEKLVDNPALYRTARSLFDAYISSKQVQEAIDHGYFQDLDSLAELSSTEFYTLHQAQIDQPLVTYIRDYINVDKMRS